MCSWLFLAPLASLAPRPALRLAFVALLCVIVAPLASLAPRVLPSGLLLREIAGKVLRCSVRLCGCALSGLGFVGAPSFGRAHRTPPKALAHPTQPPLRSSDFPHNLPARCPVLALWVLVGCSLALLGARWLSWVLVDSVGCSLAPVAPLATLAPRVPPSGLRVWLRGARFPRFVQSTAPLRAVMEAPLTAPIGDNRCILALALIMIIEGGSGQSGSLRLIVARGAHARAPRYLARYPFPLPSRSPLP